MKTLLQLIEEEGKRNNQLKDAYKEGTFPSEEVARQIDSEELYKIATNSVEFRFRIDLEILKSNFYFVKLVERYISECEKGERVPDCDVEIMKKWVRDYQKENEDITKGLVGQRMNGYEASW